jgi:hypothetical protein
MNDNTTTDIDRIPLAHSVRYVARGLPEVPNQYGPGVLAPSEITLTYRAASDSQLGRVHAYVAGRIWVDGVETPLLPGGLYGQHYFDGLDGWPEWLAAEARLHDPDAPAVVPSVGGAALRDRIAHALEREDALHWGYDHGFADSYGTDAETDGFVDAVLAVLPAPADRAAVLTEAAERLDAIPLSGVEAGVRAALTAELRRLGGEAAPDNTETQQDGPEEPTEEQIVRNHVTTLHLIGEQLADVESWVWEQLAKTRAATASEEPGR